MIIEFSGIPASGKSTIINTLKNNTNYKFNVFNINDVLLFDIILLLNLFRLKFDDYKIIKKSFDIVKNSKNSFFHKINIMRNVIKKFVIYRIIEKKKDIYIIDEGIIHLPFILFVDINKKINENEVIDFIKLLKNYNINLFVIDVEDKILLDRVIKRGKKGHRRIDFDNINNVKKFMKQSRVVLELLKQELNPIIYENKGEIDLQKIKRLLGIENV